MITVFFIITTAVSVIGLMAHSIGMEAIVKYMEDKGYEAPSDAEIRSCCIYVVKRRLHIH